MSHVAYVAAMLLATACVLAAHYTVSPVWGFLDGCGLALAVILARYSGRLGLIEEAESFGRSVLKQAAKEEQPKSKETML